MNLRPHLAIFLIVAVLNPFCCCNAAPVEPEKSAAVSSCPHCPDLPADEVPEPTRDCCQDQEFTQDSKVFAIGQAQPLTGSADTLHTTDLPPPTRVEAVAATPPAPAFPGSPPFRVRFCTYLL